jgi:hypothetical protein
MRPIFPSRRCLPPEKPAGRALLRGFVRGCAATTGRWWPLPHVFIDVRERRLDPVTARRCRGRFVGRMRFRGFCKCSVSTSTTTDHSNIPDHRIRGLGRLPARSKETFQSRATAGGTQGQGSRKNRISTFPIVIAHDGDFAPTPIAPGTSCREHRSSPCPERRGGESGIADIAPACTAGTTRGSCDA